MSGTDNILSENFVGKFCAIRHLVSIHKAAAIGALIAKFTFCGISHRRYGAAVHQLAPRSWAAAVAISSAPARADITLSFAPLTHSIAVSSTYTEHGEMERRIHQGGIFVNKNENAIWLSGSPPGRWL